MEYINGLQNVMDYYYFVMLPFYCLTIINLIVALSAKEWKRGGIKFVVVQICVFIALVSHFYFFGVLSDNNIEIQSLVAQMMVLVILNILGLAIGFIRMGKNRDEIKS